MKKYGKFTAWLLAGWFILALSASALHVFSAHDAGGHILTIADCIFDAHFEGDGWAEIPRRIAQPYPNEAIRRRLIHLRFT